MYSLGKRLTALKEMILEAHPHAHYSDIWDGCCDHGYLGRSLLDSFSTLSQTSPPTIHFVDQVEHITTELTIALNASTDQRRSNKYQVHTLDVSCITFPTAGKHCLVLAGITTNGTLQILNALGEEHLKRLDFIFCPTRGIYDLRKYLIKHQFVCVAERHVCENQRHYELLHVRSQQDERSENLHPISSIGEFWENSEAQRNYLKKRIEHHQKETNNAHPNHALQTYLKKWEELTNPFKLS